MSKYYSAIEVESVLDNQPQLRNLLYCRGFLITNSEKLDVSKYPFYDNWNVITLGTAPAIFDFYIHKDAVLRYVKNNGTIVFLIGHAYDPFAYQYKEEEILRRLAEQADTNEKAFWNSVCDLTGVYCIGVINDAGIKLSTDCTGMQMVYYTAQEEKLYVSSHSKLIADHLSFQQDSYITRISNNRFWHFWGMFLPGDLSPYTEIRRLVPNHMASYDGKAIDIVRYYPVEKIANNHSEEDYKHVICQVADIMKKTMQLIALKWPNKYAAVSVTGGRDSMTTMASAKGCYDDFAYFSYISNYDESVDAKAAHEICEKLGLEHTIIQIPSEFDEAELAAFKVVMECNAGCIGENNMNDLKKRLYFAKHPPCGVEIKSWVDEIGRAAYYKRYNKKHFPNTAKPSFCRCLWKFMVNDYVAIKKTDQVFTEYIDKYLTSAVTDKMNWLDAFYWEFSWSAGEGVFLTSEHRVTNDITIPYNNRRLLELMLSTTIEKRIADQIQIDVTQRNNPKIPEIGIVIKDVSHTDVRAFLLRVYLEVYSRLHIIAKWGGVIQSEEILKTRTAVHSFICRIQRPVLNC